MHSDIVARRCRNLIARQPAGGPVLRFAVAQLGVIGVTGTNGKTTCAWLLAQALTATCLPAASPALGTMFAGRVASGDLTTPDAITVQRQLAISRRAAPGRLRGRFHRTRWCSTALRPGTSTQPCSPT
jgi:hypothetical protein